MWQFYISQQRRLKQVEREPLSIGTYIFFYLSKLVRWNFFNPERLPMVGTTLQMWFLINFVFRRHACRKLKRRKPLYGCWIRKTPVSLTHLSCSLSGLSSNAFHISNSSTGGSYHFFCRWILFSGIVMIGCILLTTKSVTAFTRT